MMTGINAVNRILILLAVLGLSACLGGGGGDSADTGQTRDSRVASVSVSVADNYQPADGNSPISLTIVPRTSANLPVPGVQVSLLSSSANVLFSEFSGVSAANGQFTAQLTSHVAETFTVTPVAGGLSGQAISLSFTDPTLDPRVAEVSLNASRNAQAADGSSSIELSVIARDADGVLLQGVPVTLLSGSDHAVFSTYQGSTDASGRFSSSVSDAVAETFSVSAQVGGRHSNSLQLSFTPAVDQIQLFAASTVLGLGGTTEILVLPVRQQLDAQRLAELNALLDSPYLLPVDAQFSDFIRNLGLPDTPFSISVSGRAQVLDLPARTDANGQARFKVTDAESENVTVTVSSGGLSQTLSLYFGATLELLPGSLNAVESGVLTALLKDGYNAPLAKQNLGFRFIGANSKTLQPAQGVTGADGTLQVTVRDVALSGGGAVVQAYSGQISAQASLNFLASLGSGYTLNVEPRLALRRVGQAAVFTATVKNSNDLPVSGQSVSFSVDKSARLNGSLSQVEGVTDANGEFRVTVSDSLGENPVLTVRAGSASQSLPLYFGAGLSLSPAQSVGVADGNTPAQLTVQLKDASGAGIAAAPVDLRVNGNALLNSFRVLTDVNGRAAVSLTDSRAENVQVTAQADQLVPQFATVQFNQADAGVAASLTLSAPLSSLSLNGQTSVTAQVQDAYGQPVKDGTKVVFRTNGVGTVTESAFTSNGVARATFSSSTTSGLANITAAVEATQVSAQLSIEVLPGSAGTLEVVAVSPEVIGIIGSGITQSSTLTFQVKDSLGNPVADGTEIGFSIAGTNLGGGESISTNNSGDGLNATASTTAGRVAVVLRSGYVAGSVDVVATIGTNNTMGRVSIVGGQPDADRFSLAAQYLNIAGGVSFGLHDTITAFVADRFGNVVPDGTRVNFISEGGSIGTSPQHGAFTSTSIYGQATAVLQTSAPTTPNLGGVTPLGNVGLNRVVAYLTGSESFVDVNGNGVYDAGDRFSDPGYTDTNGNGRWDYGEPITAKGDLSEPYIDGNDSGTFEVGELYVDVNRNNRFDGPDGVYQSNTTVWTAMNVLFSDRLDTQSLNVQPSHGFRLCNGSVGHFLISGIQDLWGNPLVSGTSVQVSGTGGILGGTLNWVAPDTNNAVPPTLLFTLASQPATYRATEGGGQITEYPLPSAVTLTVKLSVPSRPTTAPGGDGGSVDKVIYGEINSTSACQ